MNSLTPLHGGGKLVWSISVLLLTGFLARRGLRKGSLSRSGACAAFLVGAVHMFCGLQYGLTLIIFYLTSSKLTRLGAKRKALLEEEHQEGGRRDATQVLANSLAACIFAGLSYMAMADAAPVKLALSRVHLAGAFLSASLHGVAQGLKTRSSCASIALGDPGHYAACCGDTWASELGILSRSVPRLITTGRKVPPGTNGGVTPLGLACSVAGGLTISLAFFGGGAVGCAWGTIPRGGSLCPAPAGGRTGPWTLHDAVMGDGPTGLRPLAVVGVACGLFGSLLDSMLGSMLQYSGWDPETRRVLSRPAKRVLRAGRGGDRDEAAGTQVVHISGVPLLSNNGVNFIAAAATAALGAAMLGQWDSAGV
ncbi:hypothetical protein VOLCADRAFT_96545 [Volvox carteri f. nagariensis]|uniref:Transmembrane protein 19 n=1 Tax=Volvox carteri f. nagariensis TaxID=3068 RepID=D8UAE0_VOLCA|nr:uncharacterized protein VOLCADRAFT_96545 [Volvox carteri f. nagariensis]EFJ43252.1 hypothetical protein VOLCADRAFT_96545 [Volvox carteri f. nagariensis]|eukprot:XP_002955612.1 hypothetical protein VOLCADRAFT_96545 [Volvox carteri f. nagariensis]